MTRQSLAQSRTYNFGQLWHADITKIFCQSGRETSSRQKATPSFVSCVSVCQVSWFAKVEAYINTKDEWSSPSGKYPVMAKRFQEFLHNETVFLALEINHQPLACTVKQTCHVETIYNLWVNHLNRYKNTFG